MLMNGIMMKDLTNVPTTVTVMVSELVDLTDSVKVMPDQKILNVSYQTKVITSSLITLVTKNVIMSPSIVIVIMKEMLWKSLMKKTA